MTILFKNCGPVPVDKILSIVMPAMTIMKEQGLNQFGFRGKVNKSGMIDYGERAVKAELSSWNFWREGFEDGLLMSYLNEYSNYQIGRIRLMRIPSRTCYTWHRDPTPRLHIPLITHPSAFIIVQEQSKHLPCGSLWWVNTMVNHTAINCHDQDRWHLVYEVSFSPNS